ncbi:uncharacterized protein RAG0_08419 [Rhynchosporium agropyri]|uniref:AB hydrolase-1 domain-containing protein n=1 Tax=Rhynchosporium agropyri TaxID=914238 RepID=A0A1E1KQV3_9HELO|nr:uncharacterized protein RAG0_08419 [Rhynchosporium agropyri]
MDASMPSVPLPVPAEEPSTSAEDQALTFLSQRKFHQIFTLPATKTHEQLKVTYGIAGPDFEEDAPTILYCGGMFGTRYLATTQDWFATQKGVRILMIDRPGFGGSTSVKVTQRIPIFLETVVALLAHLKIEHIALACQSAGTIFALNLISHHPDLLYPSNPILTLFSPWVHQSISGATSLKLAAALPDTLVGGWNSLVGTIVTTGVPTFQASSAVFSNVANLFKNSRREETSREGEEKVCQDSYGTSLTVYKEIAKHFSIYVFKENTTGGNDEARLCMKSLGTSWDRCEVYPTFVLDMKVEWEKRANVNGKKLKLDIAWGEGNDAMIGAAGMKYFKECFKQEKLGEGIEVEVNEIAGAEHDSIIDPCFTPMRELLDRVSKGWKEAK